MCFLKHGDLLSHCAELRGGGQERQAFSLLSKGQAQGEPLQAMHMATQHVNKVDEIKLEMHELQDVMLISYECFFSLRTSVCTRLRHRSSVDS